MIARPAPKSLLGIPAIGKKFAAIIRHWQLRALFSHEVAYAGPMIVTDAQRVLNLRDEIKALEARCEALAATSQIAQRIDTIPGFGLVCSSELAGEIGTLDRFSGEASLALYLGMANLDHSSGQHQGAKAPRHVNSRPKAAMMTGADRHRKQVPASQAFLISSRQHIPSVLLRHAYRESWAPAAGL